jgi:hypothetical protein
MNLLRRPLRPRLRPLLLSEITVNGQPEPLSPLSSVSTSTSHSAPSSRPSSHTRSPRFLPPLGEENSHHVSLVTPFQSEPTGIDQLTVVLVDDEQKEEEEEEEENQYKKNLRSKKSNKLLTPLKTREYSQFSMLHHPVATKKPQTLNKTPKYKGPPGLPARRTRSFNDIKTRYTQITDDEAYTIVNQFTFNDFILQTAVPNVHSYEESSLEKAILSRYTYKQICEMIAERVWAERGESGKVCRMKNDFFSIKI